MASERLQIVIDETGAREVTRRIDGVGKSARGAGGQAQLLRRALGALGGALILRRMQQMADALVNIENRLKLVTESTEQLNRVNEDLFDIAQQTRQSYTGTAEVFARLAANQDELGASTEQMLGFTKTLNEAIAVSGATAQEANAAMIQLAQGMASGELRGEELRSVMEQLPFVADIIADHFGVARGELRDIAEAGQLTAREVLTAFQTFEERTGEAFAETEATIGQAMQVLTNSVTLFVGEASEASGVSETLAEGIIDFSGAVEGLGKEMKTFLSGPGSGFNDFVESATDGLTALTRVAEVLLRDINNLTNLIPQIPNMPSWATALIEGTGQAIKTSVSGIAMMPVDMLTASAELFGLMADDAERIDDATKDLNEKWRSISAESKTIRDAWVEVSDALEEAIERSDKLFKRIQKEAAKANQLMTPLESVERLADMLEKQEKARERAKKAAEEHLEEQKAMFEELMKPSGEYIDEMAKLETQLQELEPWFEKNRAAAEAFRAELDAMASAGVDASVRAAGPGAIRGAGRRTGAPPDGPRDPSDLMQGLSGGLTRIQDDLLDVSTTVENTLVRSFLNFEDIAVSVVGSIGDESTSMMDALRSSASDLFMQLSQDMARLAVQMAVMGLVGGPTPQQQGPQLGGLLGQLFGAEHGADFRVGGHGGTDSQLVAFRATPGERVTVETPHQQQQSTPQQPTPVNVSTNVDGDSFIRATRQVLYTREGQKAIRTAIAADPALLRRLFR